MIKKTAATLRCSKSASKTKKHKRIHQEVFSKIGALKNSSKPLQIV